MGGMTATFGGPKINEFAQIINTENKPIDGLCGAGNAVGNIFSTTTSTVHSSPAVIWGRIAAQQTAKRAKGAAAWKAALSIALMAGLFLISQTAGATLADLHLKAEASSAHNATRQIRRRMCLIRRSVRGVIRGISSSLRPRR